MPLTRPLGPMPANKRGLDRLRRDADELHSARDDRFNSLEVFGVEFEFGRANSLLNVLGTPGADDCRVDTRSREHPCNCEFAERTVKSLRGVGGKPLHHLHVLLERLALELVSAATPVAVRV